MRSEKIDELQQASITLSEETNRLLQYLENYLNEQDESFDIRKNIINKDGSLTDVCSRIHSVTEIISKFDKNSSAILVPLAIITQLENSVVNSTENIHTLIEYLKSITNSHGGLKQFNYDNFHAQMKNNQNINCSSQFTQLFDSVEDLLTSLFSNLTIFKPSKSSYAFQTASKALSEMLGSTKEDHDELRKKLSDLKNISDQAQSYLSSVENVSNESSRVQKETLSDRQIISEYLAKVTEMQEAVGTIHSEAISVEAQITEYNEKFESFQRQLEERDTKFISGTKKLDKLINDFEQQENSVQKLINDSEDMLKSATVAGLAAHFNKIRDELTIELKGARRSFNIGIAFLFVSAIPLMILIFFPIMLPLLETFNPNLGELLQKYSPEKTETGWQYIGQVLARFIILVPAAWFVKFSSIRHASLFRLREHYAYKYSMAVSVDGFKKQAKDYEDEIAALVLEQLAFNPADKLAPSKDIPEGKSPNPITRYFLEKIDKRLKSLNDDE